MSREPKMSKKQTLIEELGNEFRLGGNNEQAFDNLAAKRLGVNRTDLACLDILSRLGPLTAGELARHTGLTTGAVTAVADRLERSGYARRTRDDEDRRRVTIEPTEKVHAEGWKIWAPLKDDWDAMMATFTVAELEFVLEFMRRSNTVVPRHIERLRADAEADSGE